MKSPDNPRPFRAIKTDCGVFLSYDRSDGIYYGFQTIDAILFDGERGQPTHSQDWVKVAKMPTKISVLVNQPNVNHRFVLTEAIPGLDLPTSIPREEAGAYARDGDFKWYAKYAKFQSFYSETSDAQPQKEEEIPFSIKVILEIDQIKEYAGFSYPIQRTQWEHDGLMNLTEGNVLHNEVDTILFPDIVLPARTSKLTSKQTYKIIRQHVKTNINPHYAAITSDYDFCFTVEKVIPLTKPVAYQRDVSRFGARKPKYVTDYRDKRSIKVFEMTSDEDNYKGYTPITPFVGKSVDDLKRNIDEFLADLMAYINEPIKDCACCQGTGVVIPEIEKKMPSKG